MTPVDDIARSGARRPAGDLGAARAAPRGAALAAARRCASPSPSRLSNADA